MALPVMGQQGTALYDSLWQLAEDDEQNGWALAHICEAIGQMREYAADLYEDRDGFPGWSQLWNVDRAPANALPFLGQTAGVKVTVGATELVQREEVRVRAGQARGRPASTISKVKATLTGTKNVRLVERASTAWNYQVVTRPAETPNAAATLAAAKTDKPGGLILTHIVSDAPIVDEGTRTINAGTATINAAVLADIT